MEQGIHIAIANKPYKWHMARPILWTAAAICACSEQQAVDVLYYDTPIRLYERLRPSADEWFHLEPPLYIHEPKGTQAFLSVERKGGVAMGP